MSQWIRSAVFLIAFYFYLWLVVDLRLLYHSGGMVGDFPVFFRGGVLLRECLSQPGGPVEYVSAFLSQFLYYSWAGALVVTLVAWLMVSCGGAFLNATCGRCGFCVRFIPLVLLLILYTQYAHRFTTLVGLLAALLFVCLYLWVTTKRKAASWAAFPVLSVILYYVAGGAYLLFAVLCAIYELLSSRRWRLGLMGLISVLIVPYVEGVLVFGASTIDAFSDVTPLSWRIPHFGTRRDVVIILCVLYLYLPAAALGWELFRIFSRGAAGVRSRWFGRPRLRWAAESMVVFVGGGAAILFSYDAGRKAELEVDYYSYHRMWPQVLQAARSNPRDDFTAYSVNRALYHLGRLGEDMFSYPQHPRSLLPPMGGSTGDCWKKADIYLDLGHVNVAENALTESLEIFGARPSILKRLALINMVKGNRSAARVYLGALGKTLFDADWARDQRDRLASDPDLSTHEDVQRLRGLMMEKDYPFTRSPGERLFADLLARNRRNRMAFEYLMAWYMLSLQLDKFARDLGRLDDFGYSQIPRHYEEAVLIYTSLGHGPVDLKGRRISRRSQARFEGFSKVFLRHGKDKQAARDELAKAYGNTYYFFYVYGFSGTRR